MAAELRASPKKDEAMGQNLTPAEIARKFCPNKHIAHKCGFCEDFTAEITAYGDQRVRDYKSAELYARETRDW
jgi:hypothetical protein